MLFISALFAASLVHLAASASIPRAGPVVLEARVSPTTEECLPYHGYIGVYDGTLNYSPACASITDACLKDNGTSIWSHPACVAAATCQGAKSVVILNQCQNHDVLAAASIPNLSFAVYTSIVGDCASSGCPITKQNYIDFVYGAMSAAGVTDWPQTLDEVTKDWWTPIVNWTATGETVPYTNFNDWLHWSNS